MATIEQPQLNGNFAEMLESYNNISDDIKIEDSDIEKLALCNIEVDGVYVLALALDQYFYAYCEKRTTLTRGQKAKLTNFLKKWIIKNEHMLNYFWDSSVTRYSFRAILQKLNKSNDEFANRAKRRWATVL
jgi:hypothetical protein